MKKLLFTLLAICTLVSCDKDNGDKDITITGGNKTQIVYADDTEGKGGVTFTTTGAWTSSIAESSSTRTTAPDWVSIDPASGTTAGTYTINILLNNNYSGEKRTATITINCGGDKITITITQEGTTQGGGVLPRKLIDKVSYKDPKESSTIQLFYDDQNRVIKVVNSFGPDYPTVLTYLENKIKIDTWTDDGGDDGATEVPLIVYINLNPDGTAKNVTYDDRDEEYFEYTNSRIFKHISYGYIGSSSEGTYERYTSNHMATWSSDNLTKFDCLANIPHSGKVIWKWKEEYTYGARLNNANLDLNLIILGENFQAAALGGLVTITNNYGSWSKNLPTKAKYTNLPVTPEGEKADFTIYYDYITDSNGYINRVNMQREGYDYSLKKIVKKENGHIDFEYK